MARGSLRGMRARRVGSCVEGRWGGVVPSGDACCATCAVSSVDASVQVSRTPATVGPGPGIFVVVQRFSNGTFMAEMIGLQGQTVVLSCVVSD